MKPQQKEKKSRDRSACASCSRWRARITVQAPNEQLTLEVADTPSTRRIRFDVPHATCTARRDDFCLFERRTRKAFWMKNTLIPLDMLFVRANGKIDSIAADVPAQSAQTPGEEIRARGLRQVRGRAGRG